MAATRKRRGKVAGNIAREVRNLIKGAQRLKARLTGQTWRRLHRVESELETIAGTKRPVIRKAKKPAAPRKKAKGRKG